MKGVKVGIIGIDIVKEMQVGHKWQNLYPVYVV